jgi:hypothetical protein
LHRGRERNTSVGTLISEKKNRAIRTQRGCVQSEAEGEEGFEESESDVDTRKDEEDELPPAAPSRSQAVGQGFRKKLEARRSVFSDP